jgi:hypothetical protein
MVITLGLFTTWSLWDKHIVPITQRAVISSPSLSIVHSAFRIVPSRCSLLRLLLYKLVSLIVIPWFVIQERALYTYLFSKFKNFEQNACIETRTGG